MMEVCGTDSRSLWQTWHVLTPLVYSRRTCGYEESVEELLRVDYRTPGETFCNAVECFMSNGGQKVEDLPELHTRMDQSAMVTYQFNSYPDQWRKVISHARKMFRAYIASQDAFPDAETGMEEVRRCLSSALHIHLEGGLVEPSKPGRHWKRSSSNMLPQNTTSMKP